MNHALPLEAWGRRLMTRAEAWADRGRWRGYAYEFLWFGLKQGWACLFGGAMLGLLVYRLAQAPAPGLVSVYSGGEPLPAGDRPGFEALLRQALAAAAAHPGLANAAMAERAQWLLDNADDLF